MPTDLQYAYAPYAKRSRSSLPIPDITDPDPVINYPTFTLCSAATLTNTRSSDIPELRHNLEYINCSSTCTFVNSNIDLDTLYSSLSLVHLKLLSDLS